MLFTHFEIVGTCIRILHETAQGLACLHCSGLEPDCKTFDTFTMSGTAERGLFQHLLMTTFCWLANWAAT